MKENRQWKKRLFGMLLAFAIVLTQVGVWNAGIESVQAADTDTFTLYYYNESEEPLYVNIWNWAGLPLWREAIWIPRSDGTSSRQRWQPWKEMKTGTA